MSVEQYRRLAGAVHGLQVDRGLKTLMVTSAVPNEGKTLTVTNLALTLSESYKRRVLLIDADLRRPSVHDLFRIPNTTGLAESCALNAPTCRSCGCRRTSACCRQGVPMPIRWRA